MSSSCATQFFVVARIPGKKVNPAAKDAPRAGKRPSVHSVSSRSMAPIERRAQRQMAAQ
jgi:hypothetical protein